MAKFDNAEFGDRIWHSRFGKGTIFRFDKTKENFIGVKFDKTGYELFFRSDGRITEYDIYPTLFWNEQKLMSDEEDKKPFDLIVFLKENLKVKKFEVGDRNTYIYYDYNYKEWYFLTYKCIRHVTVYFEEKNIKLVCEKLTEYKVTSEELLNAYKTLGWL